jgi:hypothetical protein
MGVTEGYPDGTFRGKKDISRYETASFLAKLARYFNRRDGINEKLIEELKSELALIKYERDQAGEGFKVSGWAESMAKGSTMDLRGARMDYRLKLSAVRKIDAHTSLKIGLDTVDAGYNSDTDRPFATKLIDIEGRFRLAGLNFKVNSGPGVVPHFDTFFPSENNTIYIRPKTGVEASGRVNKLSYSAAYVTRQVATSGLIGVHELTGNLKYKFGTLAVSFRPRYLFEIDGPHDVLAEVGANYMFTKNIIIYSLLGVGDFSAGTSGMYAKLEKKVIDPWKTGTTVVFRVDKIGSKYRHDILDEYEFCYLNNFDRLILDGTADIGLKIKQKLNDKLACEWKGDYVTTGAWEYGADHPETYFLWQLGLDYSLAKNIEANAFYRSYNVPSGIAQFSDSVPTVSEVIGLGVRCGF